MTTHRVVFLALTAACSGGSDDPDDTGPGLSPSPYIVPEGDPPVPTATLDEVRTALQEALDVAFTVHAAPVETAYETAMAGANAACPYVYTTPEGSYWYDSCTSDAGTEFDGYVFSLSGEGIVEPETGAVYDYWYAFGGATVVDAQGHTLEVGGGAVVQKVTSDDGGGALVYYYSDLAGTFGWDGAEASGTWLETDLDPDLSLYAYAATDYEASYVELSGGFGGLADGWAVAFDTNQVGSVLLGLPCETELSGTVGVRAPDGTWMDVQFDGPDPEALDDFVAADCDGCGEVWFQGEPMGEICVDVSTLLASGVAPW
jgi:hypothetical protein